MRRTVLIPIAPSALAASAAIFGAVPAWCLAIVVTVPVLLTATHVVVSQVIRLRASARVTRSQDALQVLQAMTYRCSHRK